MHTRPKIWVAAMITIMAFCISPLAAQINSFSSNTSDATSGLFSTDVDDFLDVNNWQNVELGKFFTVLQVDGNNGVGAGLALPAGKAYLGFAYFGKFWSGNINTETIEYGDKFVTTSWRGGKTVNYNSPADAGLSWTSQISFLIGTKPLGGILLEFNALGAGDDNDDVEKLDPVTGELSTSSSSTGLGAIEAGLSWGRNFVTGSGLTFKPNLGFTYGRNLQRTISDTAGLVTTEFNGEDPFFANRSGYTDINNGITGYTGYMAAHAGLGVDLSGTKGDASLWLGYDFLTHTYDRQTSQSSGYWEDYNPSYLGNMINLGVGAWYTMDRRLSFGWSVESDFAIANAKINSMEKKGVDPEQTFTDFMIGIYPKIAAGVSYKMLVDILNLNASLTLYPLEYSYRKFTHDDQSLISTNIVNTSNKINSAYAVTSLGFTWFITDGFLFDTVVSLAGGSSANGSRINLTEFAALFSFKR